MLTKLTELQESDETVCTCADVSFTIRTRSEEGDEVIEREYTFSHAIEWDKWVFTEFEERRRDDTWDLGEGGWRRTRNIVWSEPGASTVDVPPEVEEKLQELLELEEITFQNP